MGQRTSALADQFESAVSDLAEAIKSVPDSKWGAACGDTGWTVAQTAEHVAGQFTLEMEYIRAAAEGKPLPSYSWDEVNAKNDTRAAKNASQSKTDILKTLSDGASSTAAYLRAMQDEQLDRTGSLVLADGATVSTEQLIMGGVLIDHVNSHTKDIRAIA